MTGSGQQDLSGQVALVTGASRGIGRAVAVALAKAGADVAVIYQSREGEAHETRAGILALGRNAVMVQADVSKSREVARMTTDVARELGNVTILVNNVGITRPQPLEDITEQDLSLIHI